MHERFMKQAIALAELGRGQTWPNPLVGAILVNDGRIVGQGVHLKAGDPHAEVYALRMAGERARGSTAYVSLEPCSHTGRTPPCADTLIEAGVKRVVVAHRDPNPLVAGRGIAKLREAGIEVITGVLEQEAARQNEEFFTFIRLNRPFVLWKCASTLDGYIAAPSGHSQFVTSTQAREDVQKLRAKHPAIGVGIGTVLADDPRLTVRLGENTPASRQPIRIVFDSRLRIQSDARIFSEPGETWVYTAVQADELPRRFQEYIERGTLKVWTTPPDEEGRVHLPSAFADLAQRGISSLLVEGGATLVSTLLRNQMVDKVAYYLAPKLLGGGIPALLNCGKERMDEAICLCDVDLTSIGPDFRLDGYPMYT